MAMDLLSTFLVVGGRMIVMKKLFWIILFLVLIAVIYGTQDKEEKKVNEKIKIEKKIIKKSEPVEWYDEKKYAICYGEMTKAHKKRGYHDSNRVQSIKVKETVCKAFAKGDINDYEGKQ